MILVTGGTGLVGSHLLTTLVKDSREVRAIYRSEESISKTEAVFEWCGLSKSDVRSRIEWVQVDLLNPEDLAGAFTEVTHVYHCAATVSFNKRDKELMFQTNIEGTANVVNLCLEFGIEKLCYVSSTSAVGKSKGDTIRTEESIWADDGTVSNYSVSKYLAEMEVWRGAEEGLKTVTVNPSVIIGPGDWTASSSNLFLKVWKGFKFYSAGGNGFVDVRDVVSAMNQLMNSGIVGQRFILVGENLSFRSLFDQIATVLKKPKPSIEAKPWMANLLWRIEAVKSFLFKTDPLVTKENAATAMETVTYSNQKIKDQINFQFTPVSEAIQHTGEIFLKNYS